MFFFGSIVNVFIRYVEIILIILIIPKKANAVYSRIAKSTFQHSTPMAPQHEIKEKQEIKKRNNAEKSI